MTIAIAVIVAGILAAIGIATEGGIATDARPGKNGGKNGETAGETTGDGDRRAMPHEPARPSSRGS